MFAINTFSALTTQASGRVLMQARPALLNGLVDPKHPLCFWLMRMLEEACIFTNCYQRHRLAICSTCEEVGWPALSRVFGHWSLFRSAALA